MWRSGAAVLAVATLMSTAELLLLGRSGRDIGTWLEAIIPAIGAAIAWRFGPALRPRRSYQVGRVFLLLSSFPVALSVHTWHSTPLAGALAFHYVVIVMFAAVFFSRRDMGEQIVVIGVAHAVTLAVDGLTGRNALSWCLTMFGVVSVGAVLGSLVARMHALSYQDPLTGAGNRRAWDIALANGIDELSRGVSPLSLVLVDVDHFKSVNDSAGHEAGDEVLRRAVETWRRQVRLTNCLARLGGDEFALLLPGCDQMGARRVGDMLLDSLRAATGSTCSVGIATAQREATVASIYAAADQQLYRAKQAGRATVRSTHMDDPATVVHLESQRIA
jgi:diguanylate cyclase (GGDEF)-like protein